MGMQRVLSTITLFFVLVTCGFIQEAGAGSKQVMKYYCVAPPFSPVNTSMEKMNEFLKKESGGDLEMALFPSGQLGPESQGLNSLKMGAVQSAAITGVAISVLEPKANIMMLPYAFKTWEDIETFANSATMADIGKSLDKKGLKLMGVGGYGFFNVLSKKNFCTDISDYKGSKIRVYPTPILIDLYKTLGASPTPIAFPEIYTGLQQGVIDATDGTLDSSYASKQYEIAKYLTRTDHLYGWFLYLVNKRWYGKLSEKNQILVRDGFEKYSVIARQETKKYDAKVMKIYAENGVNVMRLSDEKRNALLKNTYSIHEKYRDIIGADLLDQFYGELNFKAPL
ncbi:TRAP transporter substrate-binding protein [Desulfobacula sp.]|uniref:TRAP transporter substrate-binding protein n=1 Tax=Desulfobacula sp. TaxID=2593537 RepID=UPI002628B1AB|nr:TRAP transporter substrate-binding protein [Desulfobacula sp.]